MKVSTAVKRAMQVLATAGPMGARISNTTGPLYGHRGEVGVYWQSAATLQRLGYARLRPGSGQHLLLTEAGRRRLAEIEAGPTPAHRA
jgi:hypothetical protein